MLLALAKELTAKDAKRAKGRGFGLEGFAKYFSSAFSAVRAFTNNRA